MASLPRLSAPPPDITVPLPGSNTARAVVGLALRKLLMDLRSMSGLTELDSDVLESYRELRSLFARIGTTHPGALPSLLRKPTIAAPLRCLRNHTPCRLNRSALLLEFVSQSLFELYLHGALSAGVRLKRAAPILIGLSRGVVVHVPAEAEVIFGPDALRVAGTDQDLDSLPKVHHAVDQGIWLSDVDNNPLSDLEAHPEKSGSHSSYGEALPDVWNEALQQACLEIKTHLPDLYNELPYVLSLCVPVGTDEQRHLSASYREAVGTIYLSLHPNLQTMTEALIHEFSHNKLHALLELDPLLENGSAAEFASPVRPDPRPLLGVLLAVHAFLPVERYYRSMLDRGLQVSPGGIERRFEEIKRTNREGAKTLLTHAVPTPIGRGVLDEIERLTSI
ncbi:MAG: HEXXH motif-containing putative peptide modification protein [Myxococcota bacterium]